MPRHILLIVAFIVSLAGFAAAEPKVVITSPDNGEIDVSPDVKEIRIEFDQPMNARGRSIVGGGESFPEISGELTWLNNKTFIIPVTLKPDHQYQLSINSDTFKGFRGENGQPAAWYPVSFHTSAAGAAPAEPAVTPEHNKAALAALRQAIDQDYAYRDRLKIDWAKEIANRQTAFENARSANEFARLTAHLLRLADDPHVSVEAGDVRIGTTANSTPPGPSLNALSRCLDKGGIGRIRRSAYLPTANTCRARIYAVGRCSEVIKDIEDPGNGNLVGGRGVCVGGVEIHLGTVDLFHTAVAPGTVLAGPGSAGVDGAVSSIEADAA